MSEAKKRKSAEEVGSEDEREKTVAEMFQELIEKSGDIGTENPAAIALLSSSLAALSTPKRLSSSEAISIAQAGTELKPVDSLEGALVTHISVLNALLHRAASLVLDAKDYYSFDVGTRAHARMLLALVQLINQRIEYRQRVLSGEVRTSRLNHKASGDRRSGASRSSGSKNGKRRGTTAGAVN